MLGLLRLVVLLLILLTTVYWSLVLWFRAGERARLEAEWREEQPPLPMHTHVEIGLRDYVGDLHRKLIWGVYVVPLTAIGLLIYVLNEV
ncbi:hypothetical protein JSE7799_00615 [Jannaschia seosinensis]|uniref:Uncharacterized protein n=1 Tax=Jannaschia seosinensis TaxID=313367 RepID=A0A0M7B7X9_9RHOB|nr:hypothetical protein [Jannaschia seosinensis]CUH23067.1 hypothetical protein JSE7799_00615 [Jannaschia seosinensis]